MSIECFGIYCLLFNCGELIIEMYTIRALRGVEPILIYGINLFNLYLGLQLVVKI